MDIHENTGFIRLIEPSPAWGGRIILLTVWRWAFCVRVDCRWRDDFLAQFPDRPQILRVVTGFGNILQGIDVHHEDLLMLSARQFEELVAELWSRLGYEVELTPPTRDGGRDLIAVRRSEANLRFLIECKRYSPPRKVGVAPVRSLYGVKTHENATKGILATTSSFTAEALRLFAAHYWELKPRDYEGVLSWIKLANKTNHGPGPSIWTP
jgi:hypothetical protein